MTVMEAPGLTYGYATADASRTIAQMWRRIAGRRHDIRRRPMRLPQDRQRTIAPNYRASSQRTMYGGWRHGVVMIVRWPMVVVDAILRLRDGKAMEDDMPINRTAVSIGLVASALGLGMLLASPADARPKYRQQPRSEERRVGKAGR